MKKYINEINKYYKNIGKKCLECDKNPARALGLCKVCYDKHLKKINKKYAKNQKENTQRWAKDNKKYLKNYKTDWWNKLSDFKKKDLSLRNYFGLTIEEYLKQLKKQNGVCGICGNKETRTNKRTNEITCLVVDHNHKTNQFRGLLCNRCNVAIGMFSDNTQIFKRAIRYIIKGNKSKIILSKARKRNKRKVW